MFEVEQQEKEATATKPKKFDVSSQVSHKEDCRSLYPQTSRTGYYSQSARVPLEEALELHKSKSYIVNLIDRALSKELGTLPEIKYKEIVRECNTNSKFFSNNDFSPALFLGLYQRIRWQRFLSQKLIEIYAWKYLKH